MTSTLCLVGCGRPSETAMCRGCLIKLFEMLREIPWLLPELDVTITRQSKMSAGGIGFVTGGGTTSMPLHLGAAEVAAELRDRLSRWVLALWEENGARWHRCAKCGATDRSGDGHPECKPGCPTEWETHLDPLDIAVHPIPLSRWLLRHPTWVQSYRDAPVLFDDIKGAIRHAKSTVYGPAARIFLGICSAPVEVEVGDEGDTVLQECQRDLYGAKGRPIVVCPECGWESDVELRRKIMLSAMENQLLTATELSRALPNYLNRPHDKPVTPSMVRGYARRHPLLLPVRGYAPISGDPRYRVGDLLDILEPATISEAS